MLFRGAKWFHGNFSDTLSFVLLLDIIWFALTFADYLLDTCEEIADKLRNNDDDDSR